MHEVDPLTAAYLAGVVDSDGFITIHRSTRNGRVYHGAVIGISGTRREPHDLAASFWGGKVYRYEPKNPSHRPQYQWSRTGTTAVDPIESLLPYLRVKVTQAHLALQLQEHIACGRSDDLFPWFGPDYDPISARDEMRAGIVQAMKALSDETPELWGPVGAGSR